MLSAFLIFLLLLLLHLCIYVKAAHSVTNHMMSQFSMASFIGHFFVLRTNQAFISHIRTLLPGCTVLYYVVSACFFVFVSECFHREYTQ